MNAKSYAPIFLASLLLAVPTPGHAKRQKPKPKLNYTIARPVDVTTLKAMIRLAKSKDGHYIAHLGWVGAKQRRTFPKGLQRAFLFYSPDGKTFVQQTTSGGANGPGKYYFMFSDPRADLRKGENRSVRTTDGGRTFRVRCNKQQARFTEVPKAERDRLLLKATWLAPTWNRILVALARDDGGRYYLVDNARYPETSRDFRVYRGLRGDMTQLKLKGVAEDTVGQVFSTRNGQLRLVIDKANPRAKEKAEWIKGRRHKTLTTLPVRFNKRMAYSELGPYLGQRIGTPCDDL